MLMMMTASTTEHHPQKPDGEPTSGNLDDIASSLLSFQAAPVETMPMKRTLQFLLNESQTEVDVHMVATGAADPKRSKRSEFEPDMRQLSSKSLSSVTNVPQAPTSANLKFHLQPMHNFQHYYASQNTSNGNIRGPVMHSREPEHFRSYSLPATNQYYFQTLSARDMQPESNRLNKTPSYVQIRPQHHARDTHSPMAIRSLCGKLEDTSGSKEHKNVELAYRASAVNGMFNLPNRMATTNSRVLLPNPVSSGTMPSPLPSSSQESSPNGYPQMAMRSHSFSAPGFHNRSPTLNHHPGGAPLQQIALPSTTYSKSLAFANYPSSSVYTKAKRKRLSPYQINVLENVFNHTYFPSTELRVLLGKQLGLSSRTIQIWFQNKRQSWRSRVRHETEDSELAYRVTSREMEFHRLRRGAELNSLIDNEIMSRSKVHLKKPLAGKNQSIQETGTEDEEVENDDDDGEEDDDDEEEEEEEEGHGEGDEQGVDGQDGDKERKRKKDDGSSDSELAQNENVPIENGCKKDGTKALFDAKLNDQIQQLLKEEEARCRLLPPLP